MIFNSTETAFGKTFDRISKITGVDEEICTLYGSWLSELYIDNEEFWIMDKVLPSRIVFPRQCLPSDARFREDLIWLFKGNEDYAQEWKSLLEIQQRKERKDRQTVEKKRGKNKKFILS